MNTAAEILTHLESLRSKRDIAGVARFGIRPARPLGISIRVLRPLARSVGRSHEVAGELWATGVHEARILASLIEEPAKVLRSQMDRWARDFDSWDVCDQCCTNLFVRTPYAWGKVAKWTQQKREFVKRAGFSLLAVLAVHDKSASDAKFVAALHHVLREADEPRNFVAKAINWSLRQIGKRNPALRRESIRVAQALVKRETRSARWIGRDALRELSAR